MTAPLGLVLGSAIPPEQIRQAARLGEELGMGELWLAEDYFLTGGIAGAAVALEATREIKVGTGVVSALVRHPAVLAMEISTLARIHPGRFLPGIGVGGAAMIEQMGLKPRSPLRAVRETVDVTRRLLAGETIDSQDGVFACDQVTLAYPLPEVPPLYLGVTGPKMLAMSGAVADGTIGSVLSSVAYVRWARERIDEGRRAAGHVGSHRFPVFALFSCDNDSARAREAVRPTIAFFLSLLSPSPMTDVYGIGEELPALAEGGADAIMRGMPEEWLGELAVVGDPDECAAQIQALLDAGADSVALFPQPVERLANMVRLAGEHILPQLRTAADYG